jgi:hypothetical protein
MEKIKRRLFDKNTKKFVPINVTKTKNTYYKKGYITNPDLNKQNNKK